MSEKLKRQPIKGYEYNLDTFDSALVEKDKQFLLELDSYPIKSVNVKITSFSTEPSIENSSKYNIIEETIIGRVTSGSINIDGNSAIRRTCNLSLVALDSDVTVTKKYWAYNTEFKLEIGLNNYIDSTYEDIIWFNMGRYAITSFNVNQTTTAMNISISGKDKMCRLNGEISGNLPIQTDFGTVEMDQGNGVIKVEKIELIEIIKQAVREYGLEQPDKIIIRDLDKISGYELWEYKGNTPLYYFIQIQDKEDKQKTSIFNITLDEGALIKTSSDGIPIPLKDFQGQFYSYNSLDSTYNDNATPIGFPNDTSLSYYLAKINYGETAGYHKTPLVYNGDLILNVGETVVSLLDKIKNMLGEFEYFYDLDGNFVFQQKRIYTKKLFQLPFDTTTENDKPQEDIKYGYEFQDNKLLISINKTPNIANVKNDFSVWGARQGVSGTELPIHIRYAIHHKPESYYSELQNITYSINEYDWRELIYQMAKDYVNSDNPEALPKTGYEQYYSDFLQFWRQLYNPNPSEEEVDQFYGKQDEMKYWTKYIHTDPKSLNFWIDFLDPSEQTNEIFKQYTINMIGSRTKSLNDTQVKSIYYNETPELLFVLPNEILEQNMSYIPIQIQDNISHLFYRSAQGVSAIDRTNELINTNTAVAEGLNLTAIPIYYLQPNTRIKIAQVNNITNEIEGYENYLLSKISYSLTYNGTMSLTCNKIIEDLV